MEKVVDCSFSGLGVLNFRIEVRLDGSTLPLRRVLRADFGEAWIGFLAGVVGPLLRLVLTVTLGCSCSSLTERRRRYEDTTGEGRSEVAFRGDTRLRRGSDIAEEAEELESSVGIPAAEWTSVRAPSSGTLPDLSSGCRACPVQADASEGTWASSAFVRGVGLPPFTSSASFFEPGP